MTRKSKNKKIAVAELQRRARNGELSDAELQRFFAADKVNSEPFNPALKFEKAHVDTGKLTYSPEQVTELYRKAVSAKHRSIEPTAEAARSLTAGGARLLAEGDSWFNLPDVVYPPTAVDILDQTYNVKSIAKWGDELGQMVSDKQYLQPLGSGLYRHFLFSGGGNDVLGSIERYLRKRKSGDTDPDNAAKYIKPRFAQRVADMMDIYAELADDVRTETQGGTVLYVHGYANAIPRKGGKYIGRKLEKLDFDPVKHKLLARAVVREMVAIFNDALMRLAASRPDVVYVDMRPAMTSSDWLSDEIHPKKSGAKKVAAFFDASIRANHLTS